MGLNVIVPDKTFIRQDETVCFHITDMRSDWSGPAADLYTAPASL